MHTRNRWLLGISASIVATVSAYALTALADPEFDVAVNGTKVTVTAHSPWHINKEYPWKVVSGDTKLGKAKFDLAESTASVGDVPKGPATLKGCVCSSSADGQGSCKPFEKQIVIP
jgi:hypothetical protein